MERDGCSDTSVQKAGESVTKYLYQANTPEVSDIPLGNHEKCLPSDLIDQRPIMELCLHYGNNLLTVGGVRRIVPHWFM